MTPDEALAAMQGNAEGLGKGLTTFPSGTDQDALDTHLSCVALERKGDVRRYTAGEHHELGPWVMWLPVEGGAPPPAGGVPTVIGVAPSTAVVGGLDFTLSVFGTGFSPTTVVVFDHVDVPTTYVSDDEVTTLVRPSTANGAHTAPVTVVGAAESVDFTFTDA